IGQLLPLANTPLLEFWTVRVGPVLSVKVAMGRPASASVAATEIAPGNTAGALVMYGVGPALPEAATTTIPAATALATAVASARLPPSALPTLPKSDPSDMLITFMPCATAQSIASATTLVEPAQPNTRTE